MNTHLLTDERGAAHVEYAVVLTLAAAGVATAIVALGAALLQLYLNQRAILLAPYP